MNKVMKSWVLQVAVVLCTRTQQLLRDVPADAGSLCGKETVFSGAIKGTHCTNVGKCSRNFAAVKISRRVLLSGVILELLK